MKNFVKKIISILAILSILVIKLWPIVAMAEEANMVSSSAIDTEQYTDYNENYKEVIIVVQKK